MCIPNSRYGLTLAWVTSENSTMLLESDILRLFFTGPYLVSSPLCSVSGVDCPTIFPRQLLFCSVSGVDCPSVDPRQLPLLLSNYQLCLPGRVVNSHSPPRTTSGYGEISCPRILCLVSRQNRQLNRLLWQPTPIVLQSLVTVSPVITAFHSCCLCVLKAVITGDTVTRFCIPVRSRC